MLKKRDRGKDAAIGLRSGAQKQRRFGEETPGEIEGLDLLEKWKEEESQRKRLEKGLPAVGSDGEESNEEDDWGAWDVKEDDSEDSGGWIDVESDAEINISDDEDETPPSKKAKFDLGAAAAENKLGARVRGNSDDAPAALIRRRHVKISLAVEHHSAQRRGSARCAVERKQRLLAPCALASRHQFINRATVQTPSPRCHAIQVSRRIEGDSLDRVDPIRARKCVNNRLGRYCRCAL